MSDTKHSNAPTYDSYPLDFKALVQLFLVGAVTGALGWLLYLAISQFVIEPVFCQSAETYSVCKNGGSIAWVSAHVIVLTAAVAVLARMAVYRPLLIVLAVFVSLWSAHSWLGGMEWYMGLAWQTLLFGLAMALFGWIARASNFLFALIMTLLVVILARVILMLT